LGKSSTLQQKPFHIKAYSIYFSCCLFYFATAAAIVLFTEKGQPEVFINQHWNLNLDVFFKYYTDLGDGWFYTAFNIALLLVGFYEVLVALVSIVITTTIIHVFKEVWFHNQPRPLSYLPNNVKLHLVEGVDVHLINSFPSGHTCTAFCMAMILAFVVIKYVRNHKNILLILVFMSAFLIGFSRIYLMQHFLGDTIAGTFIGTSVAFIVLFIFEKYTGLKDHNFWKRSLLQLKA